MPKETALLVMDFTVQTCTPEKRKRCADSVPKVKKFVEAARAKGALIVYSGRGAGLGAGRCPQGARRLLPANRCCRRSVPTNSSTAIWKRRCKDKGIKTVVAMGTQAQTSVLHTGGEAALRGFKVIVPVDAMSADDLFPELYTAWHLADGRAHQQSDDADQARHDRLSGSLGAAALGQERRAKLPCRVDDPCAVACQRRHAGETAAAGFEFRPGRPAHDTDNDGAPVLVAEYRRAGIARAGAEPGTVALRLRMEQRNWRLPAGRRHQRRSAHDNSGAAVTAHGDAITRNDKGVADSDRLLFRAERDGRNCCR